VLKSAVIAAVLMIAQPGAGSAQTSFVTTDDLVPVFRVEVWADTVTDFSNRVDAYSELRRRLESRLPAVSWRQGVTTSSETSTPRITTAIIV